MDQPISPVPFPLKGLDTASKLARRDPLTSIDLRNVRGYDPLTDRSRGAQRCGIAAHTTRAVASAVQNIRDVVTAITSPAMFSCSGVQQLGSLTSFVDRQQLAVEAANGKIYCIPLYVLDPASIVCLAIDSSDDTISTFASPAGVLGGAWLTPILAANGKIYGTPYEATSVLKIDPDTDTASTISPLPSLGGGSIGGRCPHAILAANGKIYCPPSRANSVLVIDPTSDTLTAIATGSSVAVSKWRYSATEVAGKIYCAPNAETTVLKIDTSGDTASTFGSFGTTSNSRKWGRSVLADNGKIYAVPSSADQVLKIDPDTDTATLLGIDGGSATFSYTTGSLKWVDAVLAPNGKIYGIPVAGGTVLMIDPDTDEATTFGTFTAADEQWFFGVVAPNGKIYSAPFDSAQILMIDPDTDTATALCDFGLDANKWSSLLVAANGRVYGIPDTADTVLRIF